jgi:hypothetical protein
VVVSIFNVIVIFALFCITALISSPSGRIGWQSNQCCNVPYLYVVLPQLLLLLPFFLHFLLMPVKAGAEPLRVHDAKEKMLVVRCSCL